jgi:hypothetical protein
MPKEKLNNRVHEFKSKIRQNKLTLLYLFSTRIGGVGCAGVAALSLFIFVSMSYGTLEYYNALSEAWVNYERPLISAM